MEGISDSCSNKNGTAVLIGRRRASYCFSSNFKFQTKENKMNVLAKKKTMKKLYQHNMVLVHGFGSLFECAPHFIIIIVVAVVVDCRVTLVASCMYAFLIVSFLFPKTSRNENKQKDK